MAINKSSMMKFSLVIIETHFTIIFVLCTDIEMLSIIYIYEKSTSEWCFYFEHLLNEKSKGVNSCVKKNGIITVDQKWLDIEAFSFPSIYGISVILQY